MEGAWKEGELGKLQQKHINLTMKFIRIETDVSKVNLPRHVKIQPILADRAGTLSMVVGHIFVHRSAQRVFAHKDEPIQTLRLEALNK